MNFEAQFKKLLLATPRYNVKGVQAENCAYSDTAVRSRNCYYCFGAFYSEDLLYGRYSRKCSSSCGMTFCVSCEDCLECIDCAGCYASSFLIECKSCVECSFCEHCFSCENCFGCVALHRKKYCFFNEQLSKEEYLHTMSQLRLSTAGDVATIRVRVASLKRKCFLPALDLFRSDDCFGNHLSECSRCVHCYDSFALEDCLYVVEANGNRSSCDLTVCFESELCYCCVHSPLNYDCNFLYQTDSSSSSEFCAFSRKLKHCFGCANLADAEYCILNKQYCPEEYHRTVGAIRKELIRDGKYDMKLFFASDYDWTRLGTESDAILDADLEGEGSMAEILVCKNEECGKKFRVIAQEQEFYTRKNLPLPAQCPSCRHRERMALRTERSLHRRDCGKCKRSMLSVYPSSAPYIIYCQECFWNEIGGPTAE